MAERETARLTVGERQTVVRQLSEYLYRVRQVFDHSYSSRLPKAWWPAFVLLDDMQEHLPFLIDHLLRGERPEAPEEFAWPESLIDFEQREERWRDPRRLFSHDQKRDIWFNAGGRCCICRLPLGPDWHADHITPWSKGGPTEVSNGQALCPTCNQRKHAKVHHPLRGYPVEE